MVSPPGRATASAQLLGYSGGQHEDAAARYNIDHFTGAGVWRR